jgi:hypothetical protein
MQDKSLGSNFNGPFHQLFGKGNPAIFPRAGPGKYKIALKAIWDFTHPQIFQQAQ